MGDYLKMLEEERAANDSLLAASMSLAADSSPEEIARQKRVADLLGAPLAAVQGDPTTANQMAAVKTIEKDTAQAPALKLKYTDADFAKIARDQSGPLASVERFVRNLAAGFGGDFAGSGVAGMGANLNALQRLLIEHAAQEQRSLGVDISDNEIAEAKKAVSIGSGLKDIGETAKKYWRDLAPTDQGFSDQVVRGVGQMVGQLPLFAASAPLGVAMMWGQGADQMAEKIERDKVAQKADQAMQDLEVLSGGAITAVTEWAASKLLLKPPQLLALKNRLLNYSAKVALGTAEEGLQEFSENILQDLTHIALTNPESKVAFGEAIEAGGVGAVVGAIASGVINGALHIRGRKMQAALQDLSDASKEQKVRERDPGTYQGFADTVASHLAATSDGAVENLYIDANVFTQTMTNAQLDPAQAVEAMGFDPQAYEEARVTGGDVVIPLNDFIGKVAGTEVGDMLAPHLRSAPEAVSITEMEEAAKLGGDFQAKADEIISKQEERREFEKSANEVHKNIYDQIVQTGAYAPAVARTYASLVRDFYVTQASNMGVAPAELYAAHPYKITSGELGGALHQISREQALALRTPLELPASQEFKDAVENTPAAQITEDGLLIKAVRFQPEDAAGEPSVRTGVFYLPAGSKDARHYKGGKHGYGGTEKVEGEILLRRPLFVKGATGGKAPEAAYNQLKGKGAYEEMRSDVLASTLGWNVSQAKKEEGAYKVLEKYGADPDLAWQIVANSTKGNTLAFALQENIVAHAVREAGYDSVLGYSKGRKDKGAFISEIFDVREQTYPMEGEESEIHSLFFPYPSNEVIKTLTEVARDNPDGFTIDVSDGTSKTTGFAVAPLKMTEFKTEELTEEVLSDYLDKFRVVFRNDPRACFGGWFNTATGQYVLDVSYVVESEEEALYLAELGNQDAIFHLDNFEEIKTNDGIQKLKNSGVYSESTRDGLRGIQENLHREIQRRGPANQALYQGARRGATQTASDERAGAARGLSAVGVHYSKQARKELDSSFFGTGASSAEAARLTGQKDLQDRIYFYINTGKGIHREPSVGSYGHVAQLDNLYDYTVDPLGLRAGKSPNDFERAVMAAGYDGYFNRAYGVAIMLGKRIMPVTPVKGVRDKGEQNDIRRNDREGQEAGLPGEYTGAESASAAKRGTLAGSERSQTYPEASAKRGNPWIKQSSDESNKGRTLLIQFTTKLMGSYVDTASRYYDKLYSGTREGYARLEDFWEIPQWIGQAAQTIPDTDVYVVRDMAAAKEFLATSGYEHAVFSSMDVAIPLIKDLAPSFPGEVSIGGYSSKESFTGLNHKWYDTLEEMAQDFGHKYVQGTDYRHFQGSQVIPRLTMSQGCKYKCAFCTTPKKLELSSKEFIDQQIESFKGLDARLVYLNDKTFGQASNYKYLSELNARMKEVNPNFEGFIIQTTAADFNKMPTAWLKESGIRYVELGVESYNDFILKSLHKPHTESIIDKASEKIREMGMNLVPNIIIGIKEETSDTYAKTLDYLARNRDIISHANIYNLAIYEGTEMGETIEAKYSSDTDENSAVKSFHTDPSAHREFSDNVFQMMNDRLDEPPDGVWDIPVVEPPKLSPAQILSDELRANSDLPQGAMTGERWLDYLEDEPEVYKRLEDAGLIEKLKNKKERIARYEIPFLAQSAWHGSPHTFDKFSTSKIGHGEGAQAYGYGLYFAGSKEVAEFYKEKLSDTRFNQINHDGVAQKLADAKKALAKAESDLDRVRPLVDSGKLLPAALRNAQSDVRMEENRVESLTEELQAWKERLKPGRLYKVELAPAEDEYLLWDKPLSEQSEKVKRALTKNGLGAKSLALKDGMTLGGDSHLEIRTSPDTEARTYYMVFNKSRNTFRLSEEDVENLLGEIGKALYGKALYAEVAQAKGSNKAASDYLHSLGIRGIKYLDGSSRGKGEGNYNCVIFSEDDVAITEMYQRNQAGKRGGFDPTRLTTILTQQADFSTFLHESAHFFLTTYAAMASDPNASPRVQQDMQTLLEWFGISDLATWNSMSRDEQRKHHEAFAYNFEQYLFEGKSPNVKMQTVFERFSAWLRQIYYSIRIDLNAIYRSEHGEDLPILTGEVKQVMDRMLASDKQIQQAEAVRGMSPIFSTQEEAGMTDEEWAAYQGMQQEAHEEALAKHTTASLRQMKWLANAKSKTLKALQAQTKETRKAVMAEVTKEVEAMPVYRLEAAWKEAKKSKEISAQMAVLDAFGYSSVEAVETAIGTHRKKADEIKRLTDQRMLEEHGELTDPQAMAHAVDTAVHNEARARFIGVELRHLSKTQRPVRVMQEAARQAARKILGNKMIKDIRPSDYTAAEARAALAAERAMKEGDTATATQAKEHQLLQNMLASEALKAKEEVAKAGEEFKKVFASDKKLGKSRDMNYVNAARSILAHYGFGTSEEPPASYLSKIKAYDPEFYAEIEPMITAHQMQAVPIRNMKLNDFLDLNDQIKALWHLSRRNKQIEIDGKLLDRKEVVGILNDKIRDLNTSIGRPGYKKAMTKWEKAQLRLMGIRASLRRVEAWTDAMDKGDPNGPFRAYIWNPISEAVTEYRMAKLDYMEKYIGLLKGIEPLLAGKDIDATEIGYTFKPQELLHAVLHTGNNSNKRKLLLGRGWATSAPDGQLMDTRQWDAFIARAQRDGILTKAHYDFAQSVWDLLERMKPAAQKAHRQMYGFYFNEVTANPFDTAFGSYAGGYVPAIVDPNIVTEGAMRNEQETSLVDNSFMFPTTGRGFTKSRVDYNRPLLLNLGYLASHMDKVLRFTHIEPRVKDVARIVKTNKAFASEMDDFDQTVRNDMLVPWLQRTAMQMVAIPSKGQGGKAADAVFSWLRRTTGIQMMVANVTNTLQQFTGVSISALKVRPSLLRNALWQYIRQPKDTVDMISEKSDYMKTRINADQYELQRTMDELLLNPDKFDKVKGFAEKHGYFMQRATQGVVDTITWTGAYNQAVEEGPDEKEAVRRADAAVRMTQGSFAPEDVSRIETGSAFMRAFTQFYSYFNMQANILGTEFLNTARNLGVKKGAGRMLYIYLFGFMVPAVLSEMIVQAAGGFDAGDDDDYDLWDAMRLFFLAQARPLAAMVPGAGQLATAGLNRINNNYYDDRISTSPAVSLVESSVNAPFSLYRAIAEDGSQKRAARDVLTLLGAISGLPLGQIAKPIGYALDVEQGKASPENGLDYARGLLSGKDVNRKQ